MNYWLKASRLQTLAASICPVLIAAKLSIDSNLVEPTKSFYFNLFIILITAVLIQVNTNFVNDLCDFLKGSDTEDRKGPARMVSSGLISVVEMKKAISILTLILVILGSYLVFIGGIKILLIGALSILFSFLYTAGPYPLAYLGLAELFVIIFFGPIASWGTAWILTSQQSVTKAIYLGLAAGLISSAILVVNNLRDYQQDSLSNKKTLIVRFGQVFGRYEYALFLVLANIIFILENNIFLILIPFTAFLILKVFRFREPKDLFPLLGQTSFLLLASTIIFMAI